MNRAILVIVIILIVGYGFIEALPLLSGPKLSVSTPTEGEAVPGGITTISGSEKRAVALLVNGSIVLPDSDGAFSQAVAFASGTSILTVTATDRFGHSASVTRTLFVP